MSTQEHFTPLDLAESGFHYGYDALPSATSFRVVEILPGSDADISCKLHIVDWVAHPEYEAVSYAWGDPKLKARVLCDGRPIEVTKNLYTALAHLRYEHKSRVLWADALWYVQPSFSVFLVTYFCFTDSSKIYAASTRRTYRSAAYKSSR